MHKRAMRHFLHAGHNYAHIAYFGFVVAETHGLHAIVSGFLIFTTIVGIVTHTELD